MEVRLATGADADGILARRDRGAAVTAMGDAFATFLAGFDGFDGIIGKNLGPMSRRATR